MPGYSPSFLSLLLLLVTTSILAGQANFREGFERENPAPSSSGLPTEERLAIHTNWLGEVEAKNDTLLQIYGEIYLFYDYVRLNDLPTASTHIVKAESLAKASGNVGWQGGVAFRRGHLHIYLREHQKVIIAAKQAYEWCAMAGDSLCAAESLESLSATYTFIDSFDLAHHYFDQALPMLRKFGNDKQLQTAVANYGNLLLSQGRPEEAIAYQEEAIDLARAIGNDLNLGMAINNLASAHRLSGNTARAIAGFEEAIAHNKKIGNYQNIVRNYAGLRQCYQATGDYKTAIAYQEKYYQLQDSLIGSKTKIRIAELETKFLGSEQALELEKTEQALMASRQRLERWGFAFLALSSLVLIITVAWWRQNKRQLTKIVESRRNLNVVTKLLEEKNQAMMGLKEAATSHFYRSEHAEAASKKEPSPNGSDNQINVFNQSILTTTDWTNFKVYFDGSFPGYVQRLRIAYTSITEAEERLFLLLKLSLTSREISNILGISTSGVKKTRSRLRKKLSLEPHEGLEAHIMSF